VGIGQGQPRGALVPVSASAASGKEARQRISRSAQAGWEPGPDRTAAVEILAEQDKSRVPELVPVRYGRMLASAFTFYRGAAAIMAADLGAGPDSGLRVQLCGDAHLSNFGVFQAPVFSWFDFITGYLMIPVFIILYLGHKYWNKTRLVPLKECNFEMD